MTPKPPATDPPDRKADGPVGPRASPEEVTGLLRRWGDGDESALDRLMPLVYDELHRVAHRRLAGEHTGHTLQTTELVHEAYARFAGADLRWSDRAHFFALAARTMRRILVDYARARSAGKRGGDVSPVTLHTSIEAEGGAFHAIDVLALHDALERLAKQDARKAEAVEAHIFGGLTYQETAGALGISLATVDRELRLAKAWLARELAP
jgi:RNA polymerase sigma factor (TIGR02999 family)